VFGSGTGEEAKEAEVDDLYVTWYHLTCRGHEVVKHQPSEEQANGRIQSRNDHRRLVVPIQQDYNRSLLNRLMMRGLIEPGSFVMEQKTLLGIKRRAEAAAGANED
jgi:hypothetical protein